MLEFGDEIYYFDLNAFDKAITLIQSNTNPSEELETTIITDTFGNILSKEERTRKINKGKEVDGTKYDLLKGFVDYIIDTDDVADDKLGADRALDEMTLGYKMVFNTLMAHGIIKIKK